MRIVFAGGLAASAAKAKGRASASAGTARAEDWTNLRRVGPIGFLALDEPGN
jgi:hypothetical protein